MKLAATILIVLWALAVSTSSLWLAALGTGLLVLAYFALRNAGMTYRDDLETCPEWLDEQWSES